MHVPTPSLRAPGAGPPISPPWDANSSAERHLHAGSPRKPGGTGMGSCNSSHVHDGLDLQPCPRVEPRRMQDILFRVEKPCQIQQTCRRLLPARVLGLRGPVAIPRTVAALWGIRYDLPPSNAKESVYASMPPHQAGVLSAHCEGELRPAPGERKPEETCALTQWWMRSCGPARIRACMRASPQERDGSRLPPRPRQARHHLSAPRVAEQTRQGCARIASTIPELLAGLCSRTTCACARAPVWTKRVQKSRVAGTMKWLPEATHALRCPSRNFSATSLSQHHDGELLLWISSGCSSAESINGRLRHTSANKYTTDINNKSRCGCQ